MQREREKTPGTASKLEKPCSGQKDHGGKEREKEREREREREKTFVTV